MYLSTVSISTTTRSTRSTISSLLAGLTDILQDDDDPHKNIKNSLIGIVCAIVGNVLIALALNVQRYAHIRLDRQRRYHRLRAKHALRNAENGGTNGGTNGADGGGIYGSTASTHGSRESMAHHVHDAEEQDFHEEDPLAASFQSGGFGEEEDENGSKEEASSTYLKEPYWWLGLFLMTIGEGGNFVAYGFAPASIVGPLGVFALVANCIIAPVLFKEVFTKRGLWGVIIAIAGAVTVVLSANTEETKLDPHDVWRAITTMEFEIYLAVSCSLIAILMWASPRYGNRTILIDLGLVGLLGGYTVLSTKGISSMLSTNFIGAFTTPVTYFLGLILLSTAVMQIRYVNRALQRFDSTQVIPIQFVLFTLCVIIGSGVLYRDFERTTARQAAKFVGGCLLTFFGVFMIATGRPQQDDEEDFLSDEEGVEETINLADQERAAAAQQNARNQTPSRRGSDSARSRRSPKASRVNFSDAANKKLSTVAERGVPSLRIPATSSDKPSAGVDEEEIADSPLLSNPWREGDANGLQNRPHTHNSAVSSDTVPTINSYAVSDTLAPATPLTPSHHHDIGLQRVVSHPDHPSDTPRASMSGSRPHSHVFNAPFLSPSPFSSTVSGALADKLLPHLHHPVEGPRARRSRPGLRNSLFVSQEEIDLESGDIGAQSDREAAAGAVEHQRRRSEHYHYTDAEGPDEEEVQGGQDRATSFGGRARSLSNTLGELFGVRRKSRTDPVPSAEDEEGREGEEQQAFITRRTTDRSDRTHDTL